MSGKNATDYQQKYTRPKLRERLKEQIKASDKGGKPGEWSARKSQLLVQAYERQGGDYKDSGQKTASQKSLEQWTNENWQTADGSAHARSENGTKRYLPAKAWDLLTENQKREANRRKQEGDAQGRQYVERTLAAKTAAQRAHAEHRLEDRTKDQLQEMARALDISGRSGMNKDELVDAVRKARRGQD
jgi:hypothetical protein